MPKFAILTLIPCGNIIRVVEVLNEMKNYLLEKGVGKVDCAIILGTGLGGLSERIDPVVTLSYNQIPNLPVATVEFHFGKLIYGELKGLMVLAWQGRFHYYEGYSMEQVVMPVRISKLLGARAMLISNASGSLNPAFRKGELMCLDDHINLQPETPLRGQEYLHLGTRFPDLSRPYHVGLQRVLHEAAKRMNVTLRSGVYVGVQGPQLETRAEYRYLRMIGGDAVGMSTVPEVLACAHMGLPCAAVSVLTDECNPDNLVPVSIDEIVAIAKQAEPALASLFEALVERLDEGLNGM